MVNVGCWIHSEFKTAHSKFRRPCGECVSKRSWGVLILDFGFLILDLIQNSEFKIVHSLLPLGIFGGGFDNGGEDFLNA